MSVSHLAYGLRIEANIPLPSLTAQSKQQAVDVRIQLKDSEEFLSEFPDASSDFCYSSVNSDAAGQLNLRVRMLAGGKYYGFFYGDGARFAVERGGREIRGDWPRDYSLEDACTYLIGPVMAFALRLRGLTCLHASAIAIDNHAIALMGVPGSGKSTTATAFAKMGFPVLSDDVVVLTDGRDSLLVQPGYPRLNLWPDSVRELFGSEDALPRITPTWDKRYLQLDPDGRYRFQASPLRLGGVYILGDRETGLTAPEIEDVTGNGALMLLLANGYGNYLLNDEMQKRDLEVLSRVADQVPVRRVRPPDRPSKVYALCEAIASNARETSRNRMGCPANA